MKLFFLFFSSSKSHSIAFIYAQHQNLVIENGLGGNFDGSGYYLVVVRQNIKHYSFQQ